MASQYDKEIYPNNCYDPTAINTASCETNHIESIKCNNTKVCKNDLKRAFSQDICMRYIPE